VSSLRYIALPNWAHDAFLESSSSKPQDRCSTEVPKGSENPNPTASTSNPPADPMEILTMESPIPTSYMVNDKEDHALVSDEVALTEFALMANTSAECKSQRADENKEGLGYSVVPPPPAQIYSSPKKDLSWTSHSEFVDDIVTDYSRPSPTMESTSGDNQNINPSVSKTVASPITPKPFIKFVKPKDSQSKSKTDETKTPKKPPVKHMIGNISYLSDYEPFDGGYVSFGQGGLLLEKELLKLDPRQHNIYSIDLNNIVPHRDLTCLVAKASADECMLWHRRLVTDDFSRFTWTFFLKSKDETSGILKKFITEIENLKDQKVKIIRAWYGTLSKYLLNNGFQRGTIDQTLLIRRQRGDFILVQVYVDDVIFGSSNPQLCREFEALMHEKFQMSVMGELNFFLSLQVLQTEDGIFLSQDKLSMPCEALSREISSSILCFLRLIPLSEHNVDFHPMVDFIEASPLRIETTKEGTQILVTVDGILRTVTESSLRRNLKLQDVEGIRFNEFSSNIATALVCLATNRTYNFSKMIFDGLVKNVNNKGEGSGTPTEPHHTPSPKAQPTSHTTHSSSTLPPITTTSILTVTLSNTTPISQGEACPTDSGFIVDQDRATIANLQRQYSALALKFKAREIEITRLKARVKLLEDRQGVAAEGSGYDASIKGRNLDKGKAAAERASDDTKEMATVLTSMDAATVLVKGAAEVPTGSGSIPTAGPSTDEVPTSSDVVPTASPVLATTTVVTPYKKRKGKKVMVESETPNKQKVQEQIDTQVARELEEQLEREDQRRSEHIAKDAEIIRIHAEEELQIMIDGLDRNNETIAKYLQEYHQFALELPIERRIKLISDLVKYQDNYAKIYKFQNFKGMTFEEVKVKFNSVWKQIEDFIPIGSKEKAERIKRKVLSLEQESAKKQKTSEEVTKEVKSPDEVLEENVKEMMHLVPIEEVYVEAFKSNILLLIGRFTQRVRGATGRLQGWEAAQPVWNLVTLPDGKRAIGTKWILKNKRDARDMKSAFLYGKIAEEVYVTQPKCFKDPDQSLDFKDIMLVQVYVDDIIFGSTRKDWCDEFETLMQSEFEMSSMGPLTFFLGLQVDQRPDGIFIHQEKYVVDILRKFDLANSKLVSTPFEPQKIREKNVPNEPISVHIYRSMIGCLMYLTATRSDIMFVVCAAARHQVTPKTSNLLSVKRIFNAIFLAVASLFFWLLQFSSLAVGTFYASRNSIPGSGLLLRVTFTNLHNWFKSSLSRCFMAVAKTRLAVGTTSLPVGTSAAGGPAMGIDPLPVGTSVALLAKTVAASMEVRTVAISYVSSLVLSAAVSLSSKLLPLIGASSLDLSAATPSLASNSLTLSFNLLISTS
nr:hypothetical protein [Tanacetum cinerariifolium]